MGEKNSPSSPGLYRATNLLCHRLSQQKVNVITDLHPHKLQQYNRSPPHCDQIFEWQTKILFVCYNFSLTLHRIPRVFHVQRNPWVLWVFQVCDCPAVPFTTFGFIKPVDSLEFLRFRPVTPKVNFRSRIFYRLYALPVTHQQHQKIEEWPRMSNSIDKQQNWEQEKQAATRKPHTWQ